MNEILKIRENKAMIRQLENENIELGKIVLDYLPVEVLEAIGNGIVKVNFPINKRILEQKVSNHTYRDYK